MTKIRQFAGCTNGVKPLKLTDYGCTHALYLPLHRFLIIIRCSCPATKRHGVLKKLPITVHPAFSNPHAKFHCCMRFIPFLSRVAFLCNLFFLLSFVLQWKPLVVNQTASSTIIITGYLLAPFFFSPVVNVLYAVLLLRKMPLPARVPLWLATTNFIFLLLQLIFVLFFLYDPFYNQR